MRGSLTTNIKVAARSRSYCNVKVPWSRSTTLTFLCGAGTFLSCTYWSNAHRRWFLWEMTATSPSKSPRIRPQLHQPQHTASFTSCDWLHHINKCKAEIIKLEGIWWGYLCITPLQAHLPPQCQMPEHHRAQAKKLCTTHTMHQSSAPTDSTRQTKERALQTYPPMFPPGKQGLDFLSKGSTVIYVVTQFPSIYNPKLPFFLDISIIWSVTLT